MLPGLYYLGACVIFSQACVISSQPAREKAVTVGEAEVAAYRVCFVADLIYFTHVKLEKFGIHL